jgi:hypothetical protein
MKLGEALLIRADLLRQLASLKERLARNALLQEGDKPQEDPLELMGKIDAILAQFEDLAVRINIANMRSSLPNGMTLTAALAKRDVLVMQHAAYCVAVQKSQPSPGDFDRYSTREIKWVSVVNGADVQKQVDAIAARIRELNASIQEANWSIEL